MAERYPPIETSLEKDVVVDNINAAFNGVIDRLNRRREEILQQYREKLENKGREAKVRSERLKQLTDIKTDVENREIDAIFQTLQTKMLEGIETKINDLQLGRKMEICFKCDTSEIEKAISNFGVLFEDDVIVPNYSALLQASISVGKEGQGDGQLRWPGGVACNEKSQHIYVGNGGCAGLGSGRISIFTMKGEFISNFCEGLFNEPIGIAIYEEELFISDSFQHCIFNLKISSFDIVKKVGSRGSGVGEFESLQKLTIDKDGVIYVADCGNNRVSVLHNDLEHKQHIEHQTMKFPYDVKVIENKVFVLSFTDDPCIHVFSFAGEKLKSFISCGIGNAQVKQSYSFCVDKKQNLIIGDHSASNIKVFSQEGELLHVIGGCSGKKSINPSTVVVTSDNKIVCISSCTKYALHIF